MTRKHIQHSHNPPNHSHNLFNFARLMAVRAHFNVKTSTAILLYRFDDAFLVYFEVILVVRYINIMCDQKKLFMQLTCRNGKNYSAYLVKELSGPT